MGSLRRGEAGGSRRGVLLLLCTASFLAVADTTIVSIALPTIRHDLGFSVAGVQWVFNTYALVFGGLLLLLGRVGDLYGRRRLFIIGLVVFAAGSLVGGVAWEPYVLILGRVLQGAGTAAFVPASLSLLTAAYPGYEERSRAIGLYGGMAGLGFVAGMVGGGAITQLWGWSWVFLVNVPIALLMLAPSTRVLKESWDESSTGRLDVGGALSVTSGMSLLVYAVTTGHERGWAADGTVTATAGGLALLGVFLLIQRRHPAPLVPLGVARSSVVTPNLSIALQSTVGISWLYVLTVYFQEVLGRGALEAGLLFAPMTLAGLLSATVAGPVVTRLGLRRAALGGLAFVAVGLLVMMAGLGPGRPLPLLMVGMVAAEAGFMVSNVALKVAGTTSIDDARGGLAAGLLNTSIQLGTACGLAVVTAVMSATRPEGVPPSDATAVALRWGLGACLAATVLALLLATRLTSGYTLGRPSQEIGGHRKDVSLATSAAVRGSETGDYRISGSPGPSSPRRGGKT